MAKKPPLILKIDIHGLTAREAKEKLQAFIKKAPHNTQKIVVVHGFHNGTILSDVVRHQIHSSRIVDIMPAVGNDGESVIWLRE